MARSIDFMVAVWGQTYRDSLVDLCLPSLLAPGNLPLLRAEDGHRLLIATTPEDWSAMEGLPVMDRLRAHVTPVWIDIRRPDGDGYQKTILHQTRCLKLLFEAAYAAQSYGSLMVPDVIFSDGTVKAILASIAKGERLVGLAAMRQSVETTLDEMRTTGFLDANEHLSQTGRALTLSPRRVAALGVRHLHPDMLGFEEQSADEGRALAFPFRFWRVPGRAGLIMHTCFCLPILMDFLVVPANHTACLEEDDYENIYFGRNFSHCDGIRLVADSDECGLLSLTPSSVRQVQIMTGQFRFGERWLPTLALLRDLRQSVESFILPRRNLVRRTFFLFPVCVHGDAMDDVYRQHLAKVTKLVHWAIGDYCVAGDTLAPRRFPNIRALLLGKTIPVWQIIYRRVMPILLWPFLRVYVVGLALAGDPKSRALIGGKIAVIKSRLGFSRGRS